MSKQLMKLLPRFLLQLSPQKLLILSLLLTSLSIGISSVDNIADRRRCEERRAEIARYHVVLDNVEKDMQTTMKKMSEIQEKRDLTSTELRQFDLEIKLHEVRLEKVSLFIKSSHEK
jgi:hypothetical protein